MATLTELSRGAVRQVETPGKIAALHRDTVAAAVKATTEATAGMFLVSSEAILAPYEILTRPRTVRLSGIYPVEEYAQIIQQASVLQGGEKVSYLREIGGATRLRRDHAPVDSATYLVDYFPKGIPQEVAAEMAEYYFHDLTQESQRDRFGSLITGINLKEAQRYCSPDASVMLMRSKDGVTHGNATDIVGTVVLVKGNDKRPPEFADDVASNMHGKGIGITQLTDMLGLLEQQGVQSVAFEVYSSNHNSLRSTRRVKEYDEVPWQPKYGPSDGGWIEALFQYTPVLAKSA